MVMCNLDFKPSKKWRLLQTSLCSLSHATVNIKAGSTIIHFTEKINKKGNLLSE